MAEIKVTTYKEDRLSFFLKKRKGVQKRYCQLEKTIKDAPYLSDLTQIMSDCGRELSFYNDVIEMLEKDAELKDTQKKCADDIEYTLLGVMHFVDKWLEGDELEQDEVNRAITMREKTLRIIENLQEEIECYKAELESEHLSRMDNIHELQTEISNTRAETASEILENIKSYVLGVKSGKDFIEKNTAKIYRLKKKDYMDTILEYLSFLEELYKKIPYSGDNYMETKEGYIKNNPCEPLILEPEDWTKDEWKTILKIFNMKSASRIKIDYQFEAFGIEN